MGRMREAWRLARRVGLAAPLSTRAPDGRLTLFGRRFRYARNPWIRQNLAETFVDEIYRFDTDRAEPLIIDCGANVGVTVLYFKRRFPDARIIAFEPDPANFAVLGENVATFRLSDVDLVQAAVWTGATQISFKAGGSANSRIAWRGADLPAAVPVRAVPLAPYLDGRRVDFLKIDIEGAETEVLRSCAGHLAGVERMFVEYHGLRDRPQELPDLLDLLRREGFRFYLKEAAVNRLHPYLRERQTLFDLQLNVYAWREAPVAAKPAPLPRPTETGKAA